MRLLLPARRLPRILLVGLVLAVGLAVRLYEIDRPPLDFQATRQYRSALIARAYYFRTLDAAPEWEKRIAACNGAKFPRHEPPFLEYVVSLGYRLVGGECWWVSRSLSSLFWVIGGVFLYLIICRLVSSDAGLLSTAFYLFLPFAIKASRSFQPDPLMVMLVLMSLYAIVRYAMEPSWRALVMAGVVSAIAILAKPPIGFFFIFGAYVALGMSRRNVFRVILHPHFLLFALIALLPTVVYLSYALFVARFLVRAAEQSFLRQLYGHGFFWRGWLHMLSATVGYTALCGGLLGLLTFRHVLARALALGLWAGYLVFGLIFNYGIHTHSYYQLMLIPILGICVAPLTETVLGFLRQRSRRVGLSLAVWAILGVGVWLPLRVYLKAYSEADFEKMIPLREEIGEAVDHNGRALIFDEHYGSILRYHGNVCGDWWPSGGDIRRFDLEGRPRISDEERLDNMLREHHSELFIIVAPRYWTIRKRLSALLTERYPALYDTDQYVIFDLKEGVEPDVPESASHELQDMMGARRSLFVFRDSARNNSSG